MTQLRSVTYHIGSHSVICYRSQEAGTQLTYPGGMEG